MSNKPQRIICYGDSNTYGYDPRSFMGGRYDKENRWTGILEKSLNCDIINLGQNGREIPTNEISIQNLANTFAQGLKTCDTRLIVMLGVNDILFGSTPEKAADHMETFLQKTWELAAYATGSDEDEIKAKTILICPPAVNLGAWVEDASYIQKVEKLSILLGRIASEFDINYADATAWKIDLTYDGVHFSKEGNAAFADYLLKYLEDKI